MTREALKEAAAIILKAAKRRLEKKGALDMYFVYVLPDGTVQREDVDGPVVNSVDAKSVQFKHVAERAQEISAEAVIYVSDAWFLDPRGPEYEKRINAQGLSTPRPDRPRGTLPAQSQKPMNLLRGSPVVGIPRSASRQW